MSRSVCDVRVASRGGSERSFRVSVSSRFRASDGQAMDEHEGALYGKHVFVEQPAKSVSAADAIEDHLADCLLVARRRRTERWPLCEYAVRRCPL